MDLGILFPKKGLTNQIQKLRNMSPRITSTIISFYDDYLKKSKLFLPSHIFFWLRMSKKLTFDIFLLSKKRNVSSPELCDICATCFVSTKYNINSFFNFNQHDSFFSDQIGKWSLKAVAFIAGKKKSSIPNFFSFVFPLK